jgi:hypothetical protein
MLGRLFPSRIDNSFRGHPLALWIFVPLMLARLGMGLGSLFNARHTAITADGIPLDSYGAAAGQMVLAMFALLGLHLLVLPSLSLVALVRYRAMIPMMYLALLILMLANRAVVMAYPTEPASGGTPVGAYVNLALLALTTAGFALSLTGKGYRTAAKLSPAS